MHPLMLAAMIIALIVIFVAPRKYISIPFLLVIFLGSLGQQIYVGGLHFYILRILIIRPAWYAWCSLNSPPLMGCLWRL